MSDTFEHYSADLDAADIQHKTKAQLRILQHKMSKGDKEAHSELWLYGTKLVLKICNKLREFKLLHMEYEDAVAEGNLAIGDALTRWNPSKSAFGTWVWIRIRGAVLNENEKHSKAFLVGSADTAPEVVSDYFESDDEELEGMSLYDFSDNVHEDESYEVLESEDLLELVQRLPSRESDYIIKHYLLDMSHQDIALLEGLSRSTISLVIQRGIDRLRNYM